MDAVLSPPGAFLRDRLTWLAYVGLACFAYAQASPGPAMPLLRRDLGLSRTVGGLHFSALAAGVVVAGLAADRAARRWGRRAVFWGATAGIGAGALLLAAGRHPAATLLGAGLIGLLGGTALSVVLSTLSDHHPAHRSVAITEANLLAALAAMAVPLLVGGLERAGVGWRWGMAVPALAVAAAAAAGARLGFPPVPLPERVGGAAPVRLPAGFWLPWAAMVPAVAVEFSLVSWGAGALAERGGLPEADASLLMVAFFGTMVLGRVGGSRLARRRPLWLPVVGSAAVAGLGSSLLWEAGPAWLMAVGLLVAGLGVANLAPFLMALAMGGASAQPDRAGSRLILAGGLAVLVAPLTLGAVADRAGLGIALGLIPAMLGLALAVMLAGWWTVGRGKAAARPRA